jgi:hypothetical protein
MRFKELGRGIAVAALLAAAALAPASAQVVTRGPYLQLPTADGMVVRWRTDVPTDSRVAYGAAPGSLINTVDDATLTTEHELELTALSASTKYFYSVGLIAGTAALAGDDADHYFITSPPVGSTKATRVWVTGDGGFANANGEAVRDAFATFNAGNETDFWLLLGDNAYLVGSDANYQAAFFDMHHDLLRHVPAWPTFGNHEAFSSNSLTETGPYFDIFSLPRNAEVGGTVSGTEAYYSFDYANMHFIVLDSHFSSRTPGSPMLLWLEADLQATSADWVIAFWHHPPYSKGVFHDSDIEVNEIEMRANVLPILEDYGVDLVLCGHSHSYERSPLLDGHYGLSPTFVSSMAVDSGDGDVNGDGAYRKESAGPNPHEGAVYVVAGSSSEVRIGTLNHPAMKVGLLELGSLVLDVDGDTLTGRFLNDSVQVADTFTIVKGPSCPAAPRSGCAASASGKLVLKNNTSDDKDKLLWKWKDGMLPALAVGDPLDQTDLTVCVYDASGLLLGGNVPPDALGQAGSEWKTIGGGFLYKDKSGAAAGMQKIKVKTGSGTKAQILAKGKGAGLAMPALPPTFPLTAQMANRDSGQCWETLFPTAKKNDAKKVVAKLP